MSELYQNLDTNICKICGHSCHCSDEESCCGEQCECKNCDCKACNNCADCTDCADCDNCKDCISDPFCGWCDDRRIETLVLDHVVGQA